MPLARQFTLVKGGMKPEKRLFPRFPFCLMTFKSHHDECQHAFEIKDVSPTGMQLFLRDGHHHFKSGNVIEGVIHWGQGPVDNFSIKGKVRWSSALRIGIEFSDEKKFATEFQKFFSLERILSHLKPVHDLNLSMEVPANLKYWLHADGPIEIFLFEHNDHEKSRFEVIYYDTFVEWTDGEGLKTGKVLTKRDIDTPLVSDEEFVFQADGAVDQEKLTKIGQLVCGLKEYHMPLDARDFLLRKLQY
jgi:hypothetical protein